MKNVKLLIFTGRYHGKSNNKTHSRKKKHCSHRNTHEPFALVQMNVRRRLVIAFLTRLFSQSMNHKPSQNGFITRSPLVAILEYHNRDLFFHSRFF